MSKPKVLILRTAGTNCDEETAFAFGHAGAEAVRIHVNRLIEKPALLDQFQILCIPGGFSYGDDIAAGKILAGELVHRFGEGLDRFVKADKLVLGICNGFQVLAKTGLLPGFGDGQSVTLAGNDSALFEDRWVYLAAEPGKSAFVREEGIIYLPVAHGEGKFVARDEATLERVLQNGQATFRYVDSEGKPGDFPINPNGSQADIAGISDPSGRILGLMPHPERHIFATQHPRWTRLGRAEGHGDGMILFQNAVSYFS